MVKQPLRNIGHTAFLIMFLFQISCERNLPTGTISGKIFFSGTTIPVIGVTVEINGKKVTSTIDGSYTIEGIIPGVYTIKAEKSDFDSYFAEVTISTVMLALDIEMFSKRFTSKVHGIVTGNYSGNSKPGLIVIMINPDGSESELKTTTELNGYYQLTAVPFGTRTLIVLESENIVFQSDITLVDIDHHLDIAIREPFEFTDQRDEKKYLAAIIGNQTWMLENLAYLPILDGNYLVYDYYGTDIETAKSSTQYGLYGVLYSLSSAKSACPIGWHLPTEEEWKTLERFLGMSSYEAEITGWRTSGDVGKKMKSKSGWDENGYGSNSSGFNAVPGGCYNGSFEYLGINAYFLSSTVNHSVVSRVLSYNNSGVGCFYSGGLKSVRCIKD